MARAQQLAAIVVVAAVVLAVAASSEAAVTACGPVNSAVGPCFTYALVGAGLPPVDCCVGLRSLVDASTTTADRRATCNCLKSAAGRFKGLKLDAVARAPARCGVSLRYTISPSVDCSRVN